MPATPPASRPRKSAGAVTDRPPPDFFDFGVISWLSPLAAGKPVFRLVFPDVLTLFAPPLAAAERRRAHSRILFLTGSVRSVSCSDQGMSPPAGGRLLFRGEWPECNSRVCLPSAARPRTGMLVRQAVISPARRHRRWLHLLPATFQGHFNATAPRPPAAACASPDPGRGKGLKRRNNRVFSPSIPLPFPCHPLEPVATPSRLTL